MVSGILAFTGMPKPNDWDSVRQFLGLIGILAGILVVIGSLIKSQPPETKPGGSSTPPQNKISKDGAKMLWEWASKQDNVSIQEFGTGIVGIGALFFAYGSVHYPHTGLLIALIGFAGSTILWLHLYGSRREYYDIKKRIRDDLPGMKEFNEIQRWRESGISSVIYFPVSRLMTYFMGLGAWAWLSIILARVGALSFIELLYVNSLILFSAAVLTVFRKYQDVSRRA